MWFSVSVLLIADSPGRVPDDYLWEEVILLVSADDEEAAKIAAAKLAASHECEYIGGTDEVIQWRFVSVCSVCEIDDPPFQNGAELFSRFLKNKEAESLLTHFENK